MATIADDLLTQINQAFAKTQQDLTNQDNFLFGTGDTAPIKKMDGTAGTVKTLKALMASTAFKGGISASVDLNTLDGQTPGFYVNPASANATGANHYPIVGHAGSILVIQNAANHPKGCSQFYMPFDTDDIFYRRLFYSSQTTFTWTPWKELAFQEIPKNNNIPYVTGMRVTALENANFGELINGVSIGDEYFVLCRADASDTNKVEINGFVGRFTFSRGSISAGPGTGVYDVQAICQYNSQYLHVVDCGGSSDWLLNTCTGVIGGRKYYLAKLRSSGGRPYNGVYFTGLWGNSGDANVGKVFRAAQISSITVISNNIPNYTDFGNGQINLGSDGIYSVRNVSGSTKLRGVSGSDKQGLRGGSDSVAWDNLPNVNLMSWYGIGFCPTIDGTDDPKTSPLANNCRMGLPSVIFNVRNGEITARGKVTALGTVLTSDRDLKENIQPVTDALEKVMALDPVTFKMKFSDDVGAGFIAQDVEKILPDLVAHPEGDHRYLNYTALIGYLAGAIQEQQKQINELKAVISEVSQ